MYLRTRGNCKPLVCPLLTEVLHKPRSLPLDNCSSNLRAAVQLEGKGALPMKEILVKLGITVVAVVSIAAAQALPSLQQYSTQNFQSGIAMVNSEEGVNHLAMLTKILSLTASQQAQAKTILDQEETAAKPLVDQLKEAWDALASAEKAGAPGRKSIFLQEISRASSARSWLSTPRRSPGFMLS